MVLNTALKFTEMFFKVHLMFFFSSFRKECIFTIDPATARDLDDALSCKQLPDGKPLNFCFRQIIQSQKDRNKLLLMPRYFMSCRIQASVSTTTGRTRHDAI